MTARDRIVIAVVCALAAVAGAWFLVIGPKRDQASSLSRQVNAAQAQLDSVRAEIAQGEAARATFAHSYVQLARLGEAVPPDDNVPSLIYQLQGAASKTGVDFRSLVLQAAASASTPAAAPSSSHAAPGTTQAVSALAGSLPPGASVGPAGFPEEQFAFAFQGNFFHLANFFKRLQDFVVATNKQVAISGRLMTLNAFSLGPAPQGFPAITASISATTYLVPAAQGLLNGATPAGPSSARAQSVSNTGGSSSAPPTAAITP
jgi:type II secretory pathway pseudopilin PulG